MHELCEPYELDEIHKHMYEFALYAKWEDVVESLEKEVKETDKIDSDDMIQLRKGLYEFDNVWGDNEFKVEQQWSIKKLLQIFDKVGKYCFSQYSQDEFLQNTTHLKEDFLKDFFQIRDYISIQACLYKIRSQIDNFDSVDWDEINLDHIDLTEYKKAVNKLFPEKIEDDTKLLELYENADTELLEEDLSRLNVQRAELRNNLLNIYSNNSKKNSKISAKSVKDLLVDRSYSYSLQYGKIKDFIDGLKQSWLRPPTLLHNYRTMKSKSTKRKRNHKSPQQNVNDDNEGKDDNDNDDDENDDDDNGTESGMVTPANGNGKDKDKDKDKDKGKERATNAQNILEDINSTENVVVTGNSDEELPVASNPTPKSKGKKRKSTKTPTPKRQKVMKRIKWQPEEEEYLKQGVNEFGKHWAKILKQYGQHFDEQRTQVDLKDKWRNLEKKKGKNLSKNATVI